MCVIFAHVDDMVVGVHPSSPLAQRTFKELQAASKWGSWEGNEFIQTGILITWLGDGSVLHLLQRAAQNVTVIGGWQKPTGLILATAERAILEGARSPTSPTLMVSKKCHRVTRSSLGCEVQSGNVANEETIFLRLAHQEVMEGSVEKHQGGAAGYHSLSCDRLQGIVRLTDVSAGLGADDRRSGIAFTAMPTDGLTKTIPSAQRLLMDFLTRGYWRQGQDRTFESAEKLSEAWKKRMLDDDEVRDNAQIQHDSGCESEEPDESVTRLLSGLQRTNASLCVFAFARGSDFE